MKKLLTILTVIFLMSSVVVFSDEVPTSDGFFKSELYDRIKRFGNGPLSFEWIQKRGNFTVETLSVFPTRLPELGGNIRYCFMEKTKDEGNKKGIVYLFVVRYNDKTKKWETVEKLDPIKLYIMSNLPYNGGKFGYAKADWVAFGEPIMLKYTKNGIHKDGRIIEATFKKDGEIIKTKYETYFRIYSVDKKTGESSGLIFGVRIDD